MVSTLTAYTNFTRQATAVPELPVSTAAEGEIAYARETLKTVRSAEDLVDDPRLYNFVTTAFGYTDDAPQPIITLLAMEPGASSASAPAYKRNDPRFSDMIRQLAMTEFDGRRLRDPIFVASLEQRYRIAVNEEAAASQQVGTQIKLDAKAEQQAEYFRTRIGGIESPEDLIADFNLYKYALSAFGLEKYVGSPAQIQRVLNEGAGDESDLANILKDEKLQLFTEAFAFDDPDGSNVADPQFAESMITRHQRANGTAVTVGKDGETTESAYFRENIGGVSSLDDLIADRRLYSYVLAAFDLGADIGKPAFIRKVLEEGASDIRDLAWRLPDPRYRKMAETLAFAEFGVRNIQDPVVIDQIVGQYERIGAELQAGATNPAVTFAAYFDRNAETLTSWYQVLGDSRLTKVVFTALGLPDSTTVLSADKIVGILEKKYDIADFQDPASVQDFIRRFIALSDVGAGQVAASSQSSALALLADAGGNGGLYGLVSKL